MLPLSTYVNFPRVVVVVDQFLVDSEFPKYQREKVREVLISWFNRLENEQKLKHEWQDIMFEDVSSTFSQLCNLEGCGTEDFNRLPEDDVEGTVRLADRMITLSGQLEEKRWARIIGLRGVFLEHLEQSLEPKGILNDQCIEVLKHLRSKYLFSFLGIPLESDDLFSVYGKKPILE